MRGTPPASGGVAGPTTILDLNWLTDPGILSMIGAPIENGFYVGTWPFATGGTATSALAIAAGADGGPVYDLTNGVGSDGTGNQALTLPTPVTIPADTDCVIYVVANLPVEGEMYVMGSTAAASLVRINGGYEPDTSNAQVRVDLGLFGVVYANLTGLYTGQMTIRIRRVSGVWRSAATGVADTAMTVDLAPSSFAISLDTLHGVGGGSGLNAFSSTGCYLQKLKIWSGTSDPDTAYETANGGVL